LRQLTDSRQVGQCNKLINTVNSMIFWAVQFNRSPLMSWRNVSRLLQKYITLEPRIWCSSVTLREPQIQRGSYGMWDRVLWYTSTRQNMASHPITEYSPLTSLSYAISQFAKTLIAKTKLETHLKNNTEKLATKPSISRLTMQLYSLMTEFIQLRNNNKPYFRMLCICFGNSQADMIQHSYMLLALRNHFFYWNYLWKTDHMMPTRILTAIEAKGNKVWKMIKL
jgi:hypothetical protein